MSIVDGILVLLPVPNLFT